MTSLSKLFAFAALAVAVAPAANAWDGHHDIYRHNRSHVSFGINFGAPAYYGYNNYYRPYYAPAPTVVYVQPQPVYQERIVYRDAPVQESSYCREYNTRVMTAAGWRNAYGTACMQQDGQWHIVN